MSLSENAKHKQLSMDARYQQLSEAWRQVVDWRSKLFAGYLLAIGALGHAILSTTNETHRLILLGSGVLVATIFQLLEIRVRGVANDYQFTGSRLEGRGGGCYSTMEHGQSVGRSPRYLSFGFPVTLLTASVFGAFAYGLSRHATLCTSDQSSARDLVSAVACAALIYVLVEHVSRAQRKREEARRDAFRQTQN